MANNTTQEACGGELSEAEIDKCFEAEVMEAARNMPPASPRPKQGPQRRFGHTIEEISQAEREEAESLARKYRLKRGIVDPKVDALLEVLTAAEVGEIAGLGSNWGPAIRWRYYDADANELVEYIKLRFLKVGKGKGRAPIKCWASKGAHLYIPAPLYGAELAKIKIDSGRTKTFDEGEAETIRLVLAGIDAFGIGGCWMHADRKNGRFLVKELDEFNLKGTVTHLDPDADIHTKPDVRAGWHAFAKALTDRNAIVKLGRPPADGPKGPGDYIQERGLAAYLGERYGT